MSGTIWSYTWYAGLDVKVFEKAIATGDATIREQFVRYLTNHWAKSSHYIWSSSNTATWLISAGASVDVAQSVRASLGLSASRTTKYSVAINIPANSSKYSKLGFASDFFQQKYWYTMTVNGKITQSENSYIKTPLKDTYLIVYYKA